MSKITARGIGHVLKNAGKAFVKDKVPKLSASLAYYTIFSMGPVLLVIIFLTNFFWGEKAIEGTIVTQLRGIIGDTAATQIQEVIRNASLDSSSVMSAVIGIVALFIGATTVFIEIQDSLNFIWKLKLKKSGWKNVVFSRILSFSIVIGLGFLLLVMLIVNALLDGLMDSLTNRFPETSIVVIYVVNLLLTLFVTSLLFGIIYKVLPDAKIRWRDVVTGAIFTAVIFMIAKFGLSLYITNTSIGSTYGAAGSLVVLMLWIYFSSMIFYFGAEFTKAYAMKFGDEIHPDENAVTIQTLEVESNKQSVQENEVNAEDTEKKTQEEKDREQTESTSVRRN